MIIMWNGWILIRHYSYGKILTSHNEIKCVIWEEKINCNLRPLKLKPALVDYNNDRVATICYANAERETSRRFQWSQRKWIELSLTVDSSAPGVCCKKIAEISLIFLRDLWATAISITSEWDINYWNLSSRLPSAMKWSCNAYFLVLSISLTCAL